ncbi:MAG: hypothetical protein M3P39_03545 [Actinomycetota bacterium]|nr:hypothetical protein [Actinomycetota bacterium]
MGQRVGSVWFAVADERPGDAWAAAQADGAGGAPAVWLAVWRGEERPRTGAVRAAAALFDPAGAPAEASLTLASGLAVLFDDLAVQRARQLVLEDPRLALTTTFSASPSHFGGSLVAARGPQAAAVLRDDPFARVLHPRRLTVGAGLIGHGPAPAGPVTERYGGAPWPVDRF